MKKSILLSSIIFLVLLISASSCSKVEEGIVGKWKMEQMQLDPQETITWEFTSGGKLIVTTIKESDSSSDDYSFNFEKKMTKTLIRINDSRENIPSHSMDGLWRVEHFKNDILKIRRIEMNAGDDAPYLWREFMRLN
ncbi:MAG: hypothetical protein GX879_07730 [Bacteroidales bacterium]|nr:hypothetical protein [Bacteroidales bacterium]